ncbi:MAG: tRNA (adenosine(37)-N6)-threonylcarbamoyltransferase complex dimerization subunit type 1 TsaB, partial [Clostridia bacterium]|nr:tRNA (adenosine(37)-N6)-threonylcarbamoyltransferase complex dimerization subunit type 1 TsaB [Clostridia bacterium]
GLAFGKDVPCVGVSSLEALAESLVDRPGVICPMIDARREQVYNALFESDGQTIKRLTEDRVLPLSELDEELASLQKPVYLIGENMPDCLSLFSKCKPGHVHTAHCHADAAAVARVALRTLSDGKEHTDISLCPSYLRMPQAERERLEKLKAVAEAAQSQK